MFWLTLCSHSLHFQLPIVLADARWGRQLQQVRAVNDGGAINENVATGDYSTVSGGWRNHALDDRSTVGGGGPNVAGSTAPNSQIPADCTGVSGGCENFAGAAGATVSGGRRGSAANVLSTVGGGINNTANGEFSVIAGGADNQAAASYTSISGGKNNFVATTFGTVPGRINPSTPGALPSTPPQERTLFLHSESTGCLC